MFMVGLELARTQIVVILVSFNLSVTPVPVRFSGFGLTINVWEAGGRIGEKKDLDFVDDILAGVVRFHLLMLLLSVVDTDVTLLSLEF